MTIILQNLETWKVCDIFHVIMQVNTIS